MYIHTCKILEIITSPSVSVSRMVKILASPVCACCVQKCLHSSSPSSDGDAVQRLIDLESSFVKVMSSGASRFSRPLRHCAGVSSPHRALLFQNIEKVSRVVIIIC